MTLWWAGWMQCRICSYFQMSVVPIVNQDFSILDSCECANCGNMTAEAAEID